MKKAILIFVLGMITTGLFAQAKPDAAKHKADTVKKAEPAKQEYHPDPNQVYRIVLDLKVEDARALRMLLSEQVRHNGKISSADADNIAMEGLFINNKLVGPQLDAQAAANFEKWKADTAASSGLRPPSPGKKIKLKK